MNVTRREGWRMSENCSYLQWMSQKTATKWWHDSADPQEIKEALKNGALGVTTNPVLTYNTLKEKPRFWEPFINDIPVDLEPEVRAEELLKRIVTYVAKMIFPVYEKTGGSHGYALGQLNPFHAGDAGAMLDMAKRVHGWYDNVAIKLPSTQAGLDVIEQIASEGYTICSTINFSVAQAVAVAERFRKGMGKAKKEGRKTGRCFCVQQVGRLDDYLRDCAKDMKLGILESDILQSGLAVAKRSYEIYKKMGYEAVIMPAGLRGTNHLTELLGADMVFSLHPRIQKMISEGNLPREEHIHMPVDQQVIDRLRKIPEFVRAYEPEGLKPHEFITFGVSQKTLSQFIQTGWGPLEVFGSNNISTRWT